MNDANSTHEVKAPAVQGSLDQYIRHQIRQNLTSKEIERLRFLLGPELAQLLAKAVPELGTLLKKISTHPTVREASSSIH